MERFPFLNLRTNKELHECSAFFFSLIGITSPLPRLFFLEKTETRKFELSWEVKHEEKSDGQSLVEFEFVNFPGHIIGEYSETLIKHLEANGIKKITAVIEITNNIFDYVSYSVIEFAGLKKWCSIFAYGCTRGDPKNSPFE